MSANPITLQEAKDHLRIDGDDHDALVQAHVTAINALYVGDDSTMGLMLEGENADTIPAPVRSAMLLHIRLLHDADERAAPTYERSIKALVKPYQRAWAH